MHNFGTYLFFYVIITLWWINMNFLDREIIKKVDKNLLTQALTHTSYTNEHKNEKN